MVKLLGALCVLAGGACVRQSQVREDRRELETLFALASALDRLGQAVRLTRMPLPRLLADLGQEQAGDTSAFCAAVSAARERGEVAVVYRGEPQMDVGQRTDVLDGCPKALGIPMVLRAMNPQIIAVDEITQREDLAAMSLACGCGVGLLATIHAAGVEELEEKPLYRQLLADRVFRLALRILQTGTGRSYQVEELPW